MAGMFYSLEETVKKLGKNEAEIRALVREGKLREFRDGAKQLYKVEDVDALSAKPKEDSAVIDESLQLAIDETGEVSLAPEELDALAGEGESKGGFKLDETGELMAEESLDKSPEEEIELTPEEEPDLAGLSQEDTKAAEGSKAEAATDDTEIFVKPEEKEAATDDDTRIATGGDSIRVLGESDAEFKITDDTSGETKLVGSKGPKSLDDAGGVERLDADVNLESGGSGSGLLDLSLQADDTSLGAVLDDIYTDSPAATPAAGQTPAESGAALEPEPEEMLEKAETPEETAAKVLIDTPEEAAPEAAAAAYVIAEPEADAASNAFGFSLFVPLALLLYTWVVIGSAYRPIDSLKMLSSLESIIWFVGAGAAAAVVFIVLAGSFMSAGAGKPKAEKKPKVKKEKPPKAKKEKKPKKDKKAKKAEKTKENGEEVYSEGQ